jgi:hypothetical protein
VLTACGVVMLQIAQSQRSQDSASSKRKCGQRHDSWRGMLKVMADVPKLLAAKTRSDPSSKPKQLTNKVS